MRMKVLSSVAMVAMVAALHVGVSAQGAPGGAPAAGAPPAQGGAPGGGGQGRGGGGGRGGGRGFNLPPLLMETDAFPDGGIVPAKYTSAGGSTLPGFKISGAPANA